MKFNKETEITICCRYINGESSMLLAKEYKCHYVTILNIIRRNGYKIKTRSESHKIYSVDEYFFKNIINEESAYFLGLLYSDGCVHSKMPRFTISLQKDDIDILKVFKDKIKYDGVIYQKNKEQVELTITSKKIKNDLIKHGCVPNKSLSLKFPKIKKELLKHFIRGVFDGDGTIFTNKKGECVFGIIGSNDFIDGLSTALRDIVDDFCLYNKNDNKNKSLEIRNKKDLYKIYNYLYSETTIYMNRKKVKFDDIINILNNKNHYVGEEIIQYDKKGNVVKIWKNITEIKNYFNIDVDKILKCVRGKTKTSMNYIWKSNKIKNKIIQCK